jgi:hypothetical protein
MTNSMTCEQFENILPQLLDDDGAMGGLASLARLHMAGCRECRSLFNDLVAIRDQAASLPPLTPSRDLWGGVASRIAARVVPLTGTPEYRGRRQVSWQSAGIAAAALIALTTTVTYRLAERHATRASAATTAARTLAEAPPTRSTPDTIPMMFAAPGATTPSTVAAVDPDPAPRRAAPAFVMTANQAQTQQPRRREAAKLVYDREITRLSAIVDSGRPRLDPATVAILDRNLRIIDHAIEQCQEALVKDSSSVFLIESLNNVYSTKVKVLRIAAAAASRG